MSRGGHDDDPHPDGCDSRNRSKRRRRERAEQSHDAEGRGNSHGDSHGTGQPEHRNATAEQLATIPGVGPKMAERIVDYRQKNGGFKKVEDLMNVSGVGEKSFLKMKPLITVAPLKTGQ